MSTGAIQLSATASRSSDGAIVLDHLRVAYVSGPPLDNRDLGGIVSTVEGLALREGERTVILEATDGAHGSVTIAVTAANRTSARPGR